MIYRDRTSITIPDSCNGQGSDAEIELQDAANYYQNYKAGDKSYDFSVYKNDDIKYALQGLFKEKCAYCESYYLHIHPTDIEHFRPKGRIKKESEKGYISPGYWWLAADWNNLLPSCIDCNRKRKHETENDQVSLGKADHFPIHPNSNNARSQGSEANETPLLINPCEEDPLTHLSFVSVNDKPIAISANNSEISKLKANASIKHYGLNRPKLIEERANKYRDLQQCFIDIEESLKLKEVVKAQNLARDVSISIITPIDSSIEKKLNYINDNFLHDSKQYSISCNKMFNSWVKTLQSNVIQTVDC